MTRNANLFWRGPKGCQLLAHEWVFDFSTLIEMILAIEKKSFSISSDMGEKFKVDFAPQGMVSLPITLIHNTHILRSIRFSKFRPEFNHEIQF